jgi:hypothetical protein
MDLLNATQENQETTNTQSQPQLHNECQELKNIKYKTMLLNGVALPESKSSQDLSNLDKFLEQEMKNNSNDPWCKLNKTVKLRKFQEFINVYKREKELQDDEAQLLSAFLSDCLDKKKLSRVKDVVYDKETGLIKEIPALMYIKSNRHFTLKNIDKRVSTLKSLSVKKEPETKKMK